MKQGLTKVDERIISNWISRDSSILDLGCGDGELLSFLIKEKHVRAQGMEINEKAIFRCVAAGLSVLQEDIDTGLTEYNNKSFDYVILNKTLQQVKKPDFVLSEALRVGKWTIVEFPNFCFFRNRIQIFFTGKVPVTDALPYEWYQTPNLHFLSILDFTDYCRKKNIKVESSAFLTGNKRINIFPNLFGEVGLFLLTREFKEKEKD